INSSQLMLFLSYLRHLKKRKREKTRIGSGCMYLMATKPLTRGQKRMSSPAGN
ncbi:hypothetical protein COCMIDRAFT_108382, partial [Bipolaris oryzae ATCC 44560]